MNKQYKILLIFLLIVLCPVALFAADATIKGKVTDATTGDPLPGANVVIKGTSKGTITNQDGIFTITGLKPGNYTVRVSFIGYGLTEKMVAVMEGATVTADFAMTEAILSGKTIQITSNRARERETPVAFTDVSKAHIAEYLCSRDIPLVLNTTPSVYATATGGGAGDARINVRGFNQRNVAILINSVPTNDMENGWLYWSNWDGIADVTSSIQVQRGLSANNLAVPSIGGTLNILTDPTALERGVTIKQEIGNTFNMHDDRFTKTTLVFNSGLMDNKYAISAAVVRKTGDGINDKTWTDAWAYYLAASYQVNTNNRLELYAIGAPQRHGQNLYAQNIGAYSHSYARGLDDYDPAALDKFPEAGRKYNETWGPVSSSYTGKQAWNGSTTHDRFNPNFLNERENFFHKPQINLNWFSRLTDNLGLYSITYYSGGKGGGTGTLNNRTASGSSAFIWDFSGPSRFADWDANIAMNRGTLDRKGGDKIAGESLAILRNSRNNQWTIGNITKLEYDLSDAVKVTGGIDWRTAEIEHYREVRDLLGGDFFRSTASDFWTTEAQQKRGLGDKVAYNNTNNVNWLGFFGQAEYSFDKISAYGMAGWSTIKYKFTDHFTNVGGNELVLESDNISAYQFKGGISYRLSNVVQIYGNLGHVEKVPIFDNVISDAAGTKAEDPKNEKFDSFEAGVNFRLLEGKLSTKLSAYHTAWKDRSNSLGITNADGSEALIFLTGMDILHQGIEIESSFRANRNIRLDAAISLGDWKHTGDASGEYKDFSDPSGPTSQNFNYYVNDLKVGDAPQTQIVLGATIMTNTGFQTGLTVRNYRDFYANWNPFDRTNIDERGIQSWKVPNATVVDLHASYKLPFSFGGIKPLINLNIFNLFDKMYIQDALDNSSFNGFDGDHDADDAEIFFGLQRYFNLGISLSYQYPNEIEGT